ncbi:MAG TPA: DUF2092 domain-containing protein [Stellaceae bacterium]
MKLRILAFIGVLIGSAIAGLVPVTLGAAEPAGQQKPEISAEARAALQRMGQSLSARQFSFEAQTLRVYAGPKGEPLHIFHTLEVTVRRPNRLLVVRNGDDGPGKLVYDGKTLFIYIGDGNKYASIPVPGTIEGMMKEAMGRLGVDFPLADFLTDAPSQSFLSGVTQGEVVNTVTINGVPCLHMFFVQPPDLELELWVEKNDQSLPRRLIVTYRSLPDMPSFIATMSKWDFSVHPTDAEFVFQPPPGAVKMALKRPAAAGPAGTAKTGGGAK